LEERKMIDEEARREKLSRKLVLSEICRLKVEEQSDLVIQ